MVFGLMLKSKLETMFRTHDPYYFYCLNIHTYYPIKGHNIICMGTNLITNLIFTTSIYFSQTSHITTYITLSNVHLNMHEIFFYYIMLLI